MGKVRCDFRLLSACIGTALQRVIPGTDERSMDLALHTDRGPHRRAVWAITIVLVCGAIAGYVAIRPTPHARVPNPEVAGPPAGIRPLATGTLDGIAWKQVTWSTQGQTCLYFAGGPSSTDCGHWDNDVTSPFAIVDGDSPVTDGVHGARTTVIQGVLNSAVTSIRVVSPQ